MNRKHSKTDADIGMKKNEKLKILFLCTGNSCRSQMAEGWTRHIGKGTIKAWSAGLEPRGMDARAVKVMAEAGVDISGQYSKHVDELEDIEFDYVITLCGHASENCPVFPGKTKTFHVDFEDPPKLAEGAPDEKKALNHYRRIRDEIKSFVLGHPGNLEHSDE